MKRFWLLLPVVLMGGGVVRASDIMPRPPRAGADVSVLARVLRDTRVGDPLHHRNLVVYPLHTVGAVRGEYWTMDAALRKEWLVMTEQGEGTVPELLVENRSDAPVFLLAGEIVKGGKQNRVISQDVLLPPRSGPIRLGVFCVEEERWAMVTRQFGGDQALAHSNLRQQLAAPQVAQSEIWGEVSRKAAGLTPERAGGSKYVGHIYEAEDVQRAVLPYVERITLPPDANGMVVVLGGRVVGAELFGATELFGQLRDKLLRSYATDAIEVDREPHPLPGRDEIERFLQRAAAARLEARESVGVGQSYRLAVDGLYGSVLTWANQTGARGLVHASVFDERPVITPAPVKPRRPPIVPFER